MPKFFIAILTLTVVFVSSCGPELTSAQKSDLQAEEDAKSRSKQCDGFDGVYEGTYEGAMSPINVQIRLSKTDAISMTQSGEIIRTPTLAGQILTKDKDPADPKKFVYSQLASISGAACGSNGQDIVMLLSGMTAAAQQGSQFNGTLINDELSGTLVAPWWTGHVEAHRVSTNAK